MDEKSDTKIFGVVALADLDSAESSRPAPRPMYLIVVGGGIPGAMIRLSGEGNRVGRSSDNSVKLPDLSVSRRHANIVVDGQGTAWLTDLGSTNGTFLNHEQLVPHVAYRLDDGDRVQFGPTYVVKFVGLDPCDERFQQELFDRAVRDALTGLYNRAYFLEQIGVLAESAAAKGLGLAVLMLDVDHFKRVNDAHGHDAGDAVLREVAQVLRESTRAEDLVARYGGEEFVLALPVSAPDQASDRAERIRAAVAARRVAVPTSAAPLRLTASVGLVYARPGRAPAVSSLVTAADRALYQAKNLGRNRVVFRPETFSPANEDAVATPESNGV